MKKYSHFPYTSTYSSTPQNSKLKTQTEKPPSITFPIKHTTYFKAKYTIFNNARYTTNIPTEPHTVTTKDIKTNMRHIHTSIDLLSLGI